jgi:flagellar protein FlaF
VSLIAYQRAHRAAEHPRSTEYRLLAEISLELRHAWSSGRRGAQLMPALHRNREMWSTFAAACGSTGNALPDPLRAGIISLALWVDRHTSAVVAGREDIEPLLDANQALMDGLAG